MASLSITAANVLKGSNATVENGTAGATITAGAGPTRGKSEFWGGLAVGAVVGGGALAIWKLVGRLLGG